MPARPNLPVRVIRCAGLRRLSIQLLLAGTMASGMGMARSASPLDTGPALKSSRPELTGSATMQPDSMWSSLEDAWLQLRVFTQQGLAEPDKTFLRRYLQYVPDKLDRSRKHPLLILLPGANVSAEQFRLTDPGERFEQLADRDGIIVVYANGAYAKGATQDYNPQDPFWANGGTWRTCLGPRGGPDRMVDDVAYLRGIISHVRAEGLPVDEDRVYLVGISKGGEMAQRAAREIAPLIAGIGMVVPVLGLPATEALGECPAGLQAPVSLVHIYSEHDPLLSRRASGEPTSYKEDMIRSGRAWRAAIGAGAEPSTSRPLPNTIEEGKDYAGNVPWALATRNSTVTRHDYAPAANGASYLAYVMDHAGHGWPKAEGSSVQRAELTVRLGFSNQDFDAADAIWDFLKSKTRIK